MSKQMTMDKTKYQKKEFIKDVDLNEIVKIDMYKDIELNRYYFDKANKRVLLYMPTRNVYKIVKPYIIKSSNAKYNGFGLIPANGGKTRAFSFNKFIQFVSDKYGN